MTGQENIKAAFSPSGTAEIPVVICYDGLFIRDHWEELTSAPWWARFAPDPETQIPWIRDVFAAIPMDWYGLPRGVPAARRQRLVLEPHEDHLILRDRIDGTEQRLERPRIGGQDYYEKTIATGFSEAKPPFPDSLRAVEETVRLLPDEPPTLAPGEADLPRWVAANSGRGRLCYAAVGAPLWHCFARWRFEDTMMRCMTDPDLVRLACERHLSACLHAVRKSALLGAEAIWIEECMTDMLSPTLFADLNLPLLQRLVEAVRAAGMKSILYYCGNPMDRLDLLLETGADALALEESKKGFTVDCVHIAERVRGRCTLFGNLDSIGVLQNGSDSCLRQNLAWQMRAADINQGRFVMSLGSPVTPATPVARVARYCRMTREWNA